MARNVVIKRYAAISTTITILGVALGLFVGISDQHPQFVTETYPDSVVIEKHYYNAALVLTYVFISALTLISYNRYKLYSRRYSAEEVLNVGRRVMFLNTAMVLVFTLWTVVFYLTRAAFFSMLLISGAVALTLWLLCITRGHLTYQVVYAALLVALFLNFYLNAQVLRFVFK